MAMDEDYSDLARPAITASEDYSDLARPAVTAPSLMQSIANSLSSYYTNNASIPLNMETGLFSLGYGNPSERKAVANIPQALSSTQPTQMQKIAQSIGQASPALAAPELPLEAMGLGAIGRGLETVPILGNFLSGALKRAAPQAAVGSLISEDPTQGAKEFGGTQLALEGLGAIPRGIGTLAEWMNPLKYTERAVNDLKIANSAAKQKMDAAYAPINARYDYMTVTDSPKKYLGFTPEETQYFTPDVKRALKVFEAEPKFNNLNTLQSVMGRDYTSLARNSNKIENAQTLRNARSFINDRIETILEHDPEMLNQWLGAKEIAKNEYYPFHASEDLSKISDGIKKDVSPGELSGLIQDELEQRAGGIPKAHYLANLNEKLKSRIESGKSFKDALPLILGGAGWLGGSTIHPEFGGILGAGAGGALGTNIAPSMLNLAQRSPVINALQNYLQPTLHGVARTGVMYNRNNQQ